MCKGSEKNPFRDAGIWKALVWGGKDCSPPGAGAVWPSVSSWAPLSPHGRIPQHAPAGTSRTTQPIKTYSLIKCAECNQNQKITLCVATYCIYQCCCGSGSGFNGVPGSGSRRAKMTHKHIKKLIFFIFWSAGCSLLRAEVFSCSLDISKYLESTVTSFFLITDDLVQIVKCYHINHLKIPRPTTNVPMYDCMRHFCVSLKKQVIFCFK